MANKKEKTEWQELKEVIEECSGTSYDREEDEISSRTCCHVLSYQEHSKSCCLVKALALVEELEQFM